MSLIRRGGRVKVSRSKPRDREERIELPLAGNGYNYEAQEVARCLGEGLTESAVMSLDETVALMRILDEIRAQNRLEIPNGMKGK